MNALDNVRFPQVKVATQEEKRFGESNQNRLNKNFRRISDAIASIERDIEKLPLNILSRIVNPSDYIISNAESEGWNVRKYKSGTIECWRNFSNIQKTFATESGSLYIETHSVSIPSEIAVVHDVRVVAASDDLPVFASVLNSALPVVSFRLFSTLPGFASISLYIQITGV